MHCLEILTIYMVYILCITFIYACTKSTSSHFFSKQKKKFEEHWTCEDNSPSVSLSKDEFIRGKVPYTLEIANTFSLSQFWFAEMFYAAFRVFIFLFDYFYFNFALIFWVYLTDNITLVLGVQHSNISLYIILCSPQV